MGPAVWLCSNSVSHRHQSAPGLNLGKQWHLLFSSSQKKDFGHHFAFGITSYFYEFGKPRKSQSGLS
jgi:hypothetical protein